jgi:hypothetical protein
MPEVLAIILLPSVHGQFGFLFQVYMAQVFESFKTFRKFLLLLGYQSEKMKNK